MSSPTVAILGLGAMGSAMAIHLLHQGTSIIGFDVYAPTLTRFQTQASTISGAKATISSSPFEAARDADIVLLMVANQTHVDDALFGEQGAVHSLKAGAAVVICSTIAPGGPRSVQERLRQTGRGDVLLVDAPVSGGVVGSASGTLSIMASTDDESVLTAGAVRTVLALLSANGKKFFVIPGGLGSGMSAKALNQVMCGTHIVGASEIMALAAVCGINTRTFFEDMKSKDPNAVDGADGPTAKRYGWTWMFENRGPRMLDASLPIASATAIIVKDVGIIRDEETRLRIDLPLLNQVHRVLARCVDAGLAGQDDAYISQWYLGLDTDRRHLAMNLAQHGTAQVNPAEQTAVTTTLLLAHSMVNFMSAYETVLFAQALDLLGDTQRSMWFEIISGAAGGSRVFSEVIPRAFGKIPDWKAGFVEYAREVFGREDLGGVEKLVSRAEVVGVEPVLVRTALEFVKLQIGS